MHTNRHGFTLVELSIVLVILGLLVGGVLAGQSLIRAAELRSVTTDLQRYHTSVYTFRDKYFALPGDMTNATAFWGVRAGTGSDVTCHQTVGSTTGTCNGNGDGSIESIAGDSATLGERYAAWQHLARAGLIEGSYTGASTSSSSAGTAISTNVPRGKLSNSFFAFGWISGPVSGSTQYFDGSYNINILGMGTTGTPPLKPEEAWNLDVKMDDGRPGYGVMWSLKSSSTWNPNCTTTAVASTSEYNLSSTSSLCQIWYTLK